MSGRTVRPEDRMPMADVEQHNLIVEAMRTVAAAWPRKKRKSQASGYAYAVAAEALRMRMHCVGRIRGLTGRGRWLEQKLQERADECADWMNWNAELREQLRRLNEVHIELIGKYERLKGALDAVLEIRLDLLNDLHGLDLREKGELCDRLAAACEE